MNWLQNFIVRLFKIEPARDRPVTIVEPHTFRETVIRNKIWYQGDRLPDGGLKRHASGRHMRKAACEKCTAESSAL